MRMSLAVGSAVAVCWAVVWRVSSVSSGSLTGVRLVMVPALVCRSKRTRIGLAELLVACEMIDTSRMATRWVEAGVVGAIAGGKIAAGAVVVGVVVVDHHGERP